MKKFAKYVAEIIIIAGIAVFVVYLSRQYVFSPYGISGASMIPSFHDGDYVFVDKLTYEYFREPERGEVVIFHGAESDNQNLLKRIIGLPGERVLIQDGAVAVFNEENPEGLALSESYLDPATSTTGATDVTLGEDEYFVMGDNRSVSYDSRAWGALSLERIVGKVALRIWPPNTTRVFGAVQY